MMASRLHDKTGRASRPRGVSRGHASRPRGVSRGRADSGNRNYNTGSYRFSVVLRLAGTWHRMGPNNKTDKKIRQLQTITHVLVFSSGITHVHKPQP